MTLARSMRRSNGDEPSYAVVLVNDVAIANPGHHDRDRGRFADWRSRLCDSAEHPPNLFSNSNSCPSPSQPPRVAWSIGLGLRRVLAPGAREFYMANKMIIDASHPEETRVVVLRGNRVEEFDFESASKRPLRGNIYLAKVTRVEPSLQAAFVDYGGNRHGFLAFSEIHPDYYQIPVADRQALLEEEALSQRDDEDEPNGETAQPPTSSAAPFGERRARRRQRCRFRAGACGRARDEARNELC